ncbi:hypothetical protein [Euzebya rosea]|uniref:hypothetical protein n=1 Tax=Euzebya rosea TaxID=2052804 RepID=UPI0013006270|nr:hypothetical protein [Euzebya rosea]
MTTARQLGPPGAIRHIDLPRVLHYPEGTRYTARVEGHLTQAPTPDHADAPADQHADHRDPYDPMWLREHSRDWDIVHVHIGLPPGTDARLPIALDTHRRQGTPVLVTLHDLPGSGTIAGDALDLPAVQRVLADAWVVTTFTRGAARTILERTGIRPRVIPHGPMLSGADLLRARRYRTACGGEWGPILVEVDPHHPASDVTGALDACALLAGSMPVRLLVHTVHEKAIARHPGLDGADLVVHHGLSFDQLVDHIAAARALVLPLTAGLHSQRLELAADIGTPVIAGRVGHLAEQHPIVGVPVLDGHIDAAALAEAMLTRPDPTLVSRVEDREHAWSDVCMAHERLYSTARSHGVHTADQTASAR